MERESVSLNRSGIPQISTDESVTNPTTTLNLDSPSDPSNNASLFFLSRWHNSKADDLRMNLLTILFGGEENIPVEYFTLHQIQAAQERNLLSQNLDSLIQLAQNHDDFESFSSLSKDFWKQVKQMSEIRLIETFINGESKTVAVSKYGELLERFNRSGATLENFAKFLLPNEAKVFLARHQINQTFGAHELFIGNGIALEKSGQFPVRVFLEGNGKNPEFPANAFFSLLSGELFADKNSRLNNFSILNNPAIFADAQLLLSAKSAALLSLSLALYQNVNARLSLGDVALDSFLPKNLNVLSENFVNRLTNQNLPENLKNNAFSFESIVIAAYLKGVFSMFEEFRKNGNRSIGNWKFGDSENANFTYSAGATGAIMGASIGCVSSLAGKNTGEILGFAASAVVGLADSGLRKLSANTIVSVVTSGVQKFLEATSETPKKFEEQTEIKSLNPANIAENFEFDLRQRLFNSRIKTLSAT